MGINHLTSRSGIGSVALPTIYFFCILLCRAPILFMTSMAQWEAVERMFEYLRGWALSRTSGIETSTK